MHVCLVTETYPPEINGVALTVQSLARGLRSLGHHVSLIRPSQPGAKDEGEFDQCLVAGVRLPRYPGLRFGLPMVGRLRRQWRRKRPDVIYVATEGPLGWAAVRSARRLGIPVASGFHTRFEDYFDVYGLGMVAPLVMRWMRRFHNRTLATLVPTRELQEYLATHGIDNARVHRRSVDADLFRPGRRCPDLRRQWQVPDGGLAVIHVGRIAEEKNLDLNVHAFRRIQATRPDARYIWVGDGPARTRLAAQNPDFVFAGVQHGEALARHYASADLFVFASLSETFGNVTLEAMASGVATVAFDYGAAREHIEHPGLGLTVPRDDPDGFVAAAMHLAGDDELRRAIGHSAARAMAGKRGGDAAASFATILAGLMPAGPRHVLARAA